jgi:transposase
LLLTDVHRKAFTCVLANTTQIAQVPGRKTAVKDCAGIAELPAHRLIRGSFGPPVPLRELLDLTRYPKGADPGTDPREANWLHKVLEDTGVTLASVASDALGESGRAIVKALVAVTTYPAGLADLARGAVREFFVTQLLVHLNYLDEVIAPPSAEIDAVIAPFAQDVARDAIHG